MLQLEPNVIAELLKDRKALEALRNGIALRFQQPADASIYSDSYSTQISFRDFSIVVRAGRMIVQAGSRRTSQTLLDQVKETAEKLSGQLASVALGVRLTESLKKAFNGTATKVPGFGNKTRIDLTVRL
jgi:hypothetical protein